MSFVKSRFKKWGRFKKIKLIPKSQRASQPIPELKKLLPLEKINR
jgi:hypothetical protein